MAEGTGGPQTTISRVASGNLTARQFSFVRGSGNDVMNYVTSGGLMLGVLQNHPNDNQMATIVVAGPTKISMGASLGPNVFVTGDTAGLAIRAAGSGSYVGGMLITGAVSGAIGELLACVPYRAVGLSGEAA